MIGDAYSPFPSPLFTFALQCPFGNVTLASIPDALMPLRVCDALADCGDEGWPPRHVAVQRHLDPLRTAGLALGIQLIECFLEPIEHDARRIVRPHPHNEIILWDVDTWHHDH